MLMSSNESNSNSASTLGGAPGTSRSSVALTVVTMTVLAALVWGLSPARPGFEPAPLRPHPPGCPKLGIEFVPSNYTSVPGVQLDPLSPEQRNRVLLRLNMEPCTCGCNFSVASCLIDHPQCGMSKDLAQNIVAEEQGAKGR